MDCLQVRGHFQRYFIVLRDSPHIVPAPQGQSGPWPPDANFSCQDSRMKFSFLSSRPRWWNPFSPNNHWMVRWLFSDDTNNLHTVRPLCADASWEDMGNQIKLLVLLPSRSRSGLGSDGPAMTPDNAILLATNHTPHELMSRDNNSKKLEGRSWWLMLKDSYLAVTTY